MTTLPTENLGLDVNRQIREPLALLRRKLRLYLTLEGVWAILLGVVVLMFSQFVIDRVLRLSVDQRVLLSVIVLGAIAYIVVRALVKRLSIQLSDTYLAGLIDRSHPELNDRIATGIQFAGGDIGHANSNSPALVREVVREACEAANQVDFTAVLNHARAKKRIHGCLGIIAAAIITVGVFHQAVGIWFLRNWLFQPVAWPQDTHIIARGFDDGRILHPRGEILEIVADVKGEMPRSATLNWSSDKSRGAETMIVVGRDLLKVSLGEISEPIEFDIVGGDEHTQTYAVEIVDRPRIQNIAATITPPEYTASEPITIEQSPVLEFLEGSSLSIVVSTNKPVSSAEFVGESGMSLPCEIIEENAIVFAWNEPATGTYSFSLKDEHGFENTRPIRFVIKVLTDDAPAVRLKVPFLGTFITPTAIFELEPTFEDAYGLRAIDLLVQRDEESAISFELAGFEPGSHTFQSRRTVDVRLLQLQPGDQLKFWAEAVDYLPQKENRGRSNPMITRVLSRDDWLNEIAKRELDLRREFEHLAGAQRSVKEKLAWLTDRLRTEDELTAGTAQEIAALSQLQAWHASRCLAFQHEFELLLGEMRVNRVARLADERRLGSYIVEPLGELGNEDMSAASSAIATLGDSAASTNIEQLQSNQNAIIGKMDDVLAHMLKWEGYREILKLVEEIIADEEAVRSETLKSFEAELGDILDLIEEEPSEESE